MKSDCLFCRIATGAEPAEIVYQDRNNFPPFRYICHLIGRRLAIARTCSADQSIPGFDEAVKQMILADTANETMLNQNWVAIPVSIFSV